MSSVLLLYNSPVSKVSPSFNVFGLFGSFLGEELGLVLKQLLMVEVVKPIETVYAVSGLHKHTLPVTGASPEKLG